MLSISWWVVQKILITFIRAKDWNQGSNFKGIAILASYNLIWIKHRWPVFLAKNLFALENLVLCIVSLGTKTNFFPQTQLISKVLTYIIFSAWIYEETKNIFWASEIVATLTHVERFYDLMKLKLFCFAWWISYLSVNSNQGF